MNELIDMGWLESKMAATDEADKVTHFSTSV